MQINQPAIVIVAYNRPEALVRILDSIASAHYTGYSDIKLIISIDGCGDKNMDVTRAARAFNWKFGNKEIIERPSNLGLRNHVIACGDLTNKYDNIIVLEEDSFVSRNFYHYAVQSLIAYSTDKHIAGISLYSYHYYESFGTVFIPIADGYDTYFMQVPSSLGQIWTKKQWANFKAYYNTKPTIETTDKIPEKVKTWPESSWKKYFYKYMVERDLYFVYPQTALATNFGDIGTHMLNKTQLYQIPLEIYRTDKQYNFPAFEKSANKYDAYFELLPECLIAQEINIDIDTCIDIFGSKPLSSFSNKYMLSSKACTVSIISFDNVLIPTINNVLYSQQGHSIHYALRVDFTSMKASARLQQIANSESLGYSEGIQHVISSRYYKLGYYILNPNKIIPMMKRKITKTRNCFPER
jgi:hypothetical protein